MIAVFGVMSECVKEVLVAKALGSFRPIGICRGTPEDQGEKHGTQLESWHLGCHLLGTIL